jgi:steroid 5-alpha reductase family enzyme
MSFSLLWIVLAFAAVAMTATWWLQLRTRNAGYVDVAWAALVAGAALFYGAFGDGAGVPRLLVAMLGGIWGFRLSMHLLARVLNEAEDGRYRYLRQHWNGHQGKFFGFFMAQALLTALFSVPLLVAASNPQPGFTPWTLAALLVWMLSLGGESLADLQLARFRADPGNRGQVCRVGLWAWSRHPNYFFEWLHWFSYVLLAVGSPYWWLALLGPVLMLTSLLWVTGIPYVEAQALRSRGDAYRRYQREVSAFVPWFPRRSAGRDSDSNRTPENQP